IASPLSDYLRAAGLPDGDIDPALAEVIPDEDGKVSDQLPAAGTTPLALPDPEPGGPSASSGPEPEVADWLSDGDETETADLQQTDRKSTRLNSSHVSISYAVFCLKKKKIQLRSTRN